MYTMKIDGKVLYTPDLSNEGYGVISPKLTMELNKAGCMEFILPPDNVMYDQVKKLKSIIIVYQEQDEIFRGRVLHDEKDFYKRKNTYCEGDLAFLIDSVQRPYSFQGDIPELFTQFITNHNSQVEQEKQFEVGEITVTDPNHYINREDSGYTSTLESITGKLIDTHGGYIRPRLADGKRYLDYISDYGRISSQTIQFGVNLLDISEYINAEDIFTCLIPLGAEQQDDEGDSAGRLTISSVNDGKDYIEDADAIALFGRIWKVQEWDDVTLPDNLLTKGRAFLKSGIEMAVSLTIKAVDLHLIDVDTERIRLGDLVRVISIPHGIDRLFLCSKIVLDLVNPDQTEYTFGVTFSTMTEKQLSGMKTAQNNVSVVQTSAQSAQNSANQANNAVQEVEQIIAQIPSDYVKNSEFEAYKKEISNKIAAVYRFKGSVANYAALPAVNREVGDTYNLLDTGANYAWTDSGWDKLSETIDLSGYATKDEIPSVPDKTSDLENDSGYITGEEAAEMYVDKNVYDALVERVSKLEGEGVTG
ncbi:MAG: phage tail protein [Lachnospiraceae bacterium]|nr:phage tail protein [Lachnospiraceae bacterium]